MFHADLARPGPGLLLRDLLKEPAPGDLLSAAEVIRAADADLLLLQGFDFDAGLLALAAFNRLIGGGAPAYPGEFALRPNTGRATGLDLDGNGRAGEARDAQGYGRFAGEGGMAVLSRYPFGAAQDLSGILWRDLPGADLPVHSDGSPFPSAAALGVQRLSTTGHWVLPVQLAPGRSLTLLAFHATPPVFDGAEDRNGRRARDEHRLWQLYLGGGLARAPPTGAFVLAGTGNLDPGAGDGDRAFMAGFLRDPRWQDPPMLRDQPTARWPEPVGALRVSYLLPSAGLQVADGGVLFPGGGAPRGLVWVDLVLD